MRKKVMVQNRLGTMPVILVKTLNKQLIFCENICKNFVNLFNYYTGTGMAIVIIHTAKTKYRNFETNIPRKGISGSQSQFPH
jgi:hypothetical protein